MLPFLVGFCIGFVSSIPPLGPGALLVMRRGLEGRVAAGVAVAVGGAAADALYCALAVVGFSYLFWKHPNVAGAMRWVGIGILISLAIWFLTRNRMIERSNGPSNGGDWPGHAILGFSLTAFNPTLILTWTTAVAVIASLGGLSGSARVTLPLGVAAGDIAWGCVALWLYRRLGGSLPDHLLSKMMRSIGALLLIIAVSFAAQTVLES